MTWTFVELGSFTRDCYDYFTSEVGYGRFQGELARNPTAGDAMPGCGGFRKIRWVGLERGKGKRGGIRVIYLQVPSVAVIVLAKVYDKGVKDDLSGAEKKQLAALAMELKEEIRRQFGNAK